MKNKTEIETLIKEYIKDNLTIQVSTNDEMDYSNRNTSITVTLYLKDEEISSCYEHLPQ